MKGTQQKKQRGLHTDKHREIFQSSKGSHLMYFFPKSHSRGITLEQVPQAYRVDVQAVLDVNYPRLKSKASIK